MNRFQHTDIDPTVTNAKREQVLTKEIGPPRGDYGGHSYGYDKYMGKRLEARRRVWNGMDLKDQSATTRPGSMNRKKG